MSVALLDLFATLPDPRRPRGKIHPLPAVLGLAVLAMLGGHSSLEAIAQFGRDHGPALAHALGFRRGKTPAKSTFSKLFRRLDIAAFEAALRRWLVSRGATAGDALALDGKTLRGSLDGEAPGVHLLSAYAPAAAAVVAQLRVEAKTNEHKAALRLLGVLPCQGKVVTGDAMFTHRDVAAAIRRGGGDDVLTVKDNQATLKEQIRAALHDDTDFSPLPTAAEGGARAAGGDDRQGPRPGRAAAAVEYDRPDRVCGLAGRRPGL
jgi:hypothetical protein